MATIRSSFLLIAWKEVDWSACTAPISRRRGKSRRASGEAIVRRPAAFRRGAIIQDMRSVSIFSDFVCACVIISRKPGRGGGLLLGGCFLALGQLVSGFAKDQIVAFVLSLLACENAEQH